jgi:signal transduction histidine kinase
MCVPLRIADQNVGVLNVNRLEEPAPFSETDLNLVGVFANNAAGAIHNAILYKRIKSFNQDLEKKIAARTKDLEAANQIKSNFLSSVSHEMQTPLNAVVGFSKVLLTDSHGALNPQQKKFAEHIAESGQRLSRIIQAMLDMVSLTAGNFSTNVSPFHVNELLESALQSHHALLETKHITIETGVCDALQAEKVVADAGRLQQILDQLISNAAKFSGENGKVTVSAELVKRSEGSSPDQSKPHGSAASTPAWLKIMIADDGPGIAANHREKIFDLFYQAKGSLSDKTSGIGVGLSIGSILAKLLGGSLTLLPAKAAAGSTFLLEVPVSTQA